MKHILGIDFGTSKTAIARVEDVPLRASPEVIEIEGARVVESYVRLKDDLTVEVFGQQAADDAILHPERTFAEFKSRFGTTARYPHPAAPSDVSRALAAEDVALRFLTAVRTALEHGYFNGASLSTAVSVTSFGHPVAWKAAARDALGDLLRRAGFPNPEPCAEPVAVVSYEAYRGRFEPTPGRRVLVYDFGGGTTDICLVECGAPVLRVLGAAGAVDLGGKDFDAALFADYKKQLIASAPKPTPTDLPLRDVKQLRAAVRYLKERVSGTTANAEISRSFEVCRGHSQRLTLDRLSFDRICGPLVARFEAPVRLALGSRSPSSVDVVIAAGGSAALPFVAERLERLFPQLLAHPDRLVRCAGPRETVALGLVIHAAVRRHGSASPPTHTPGVPQRPNVIVKRPPTKKRRRLVVAAVVVAATATAGVVLSHWYDAKQPAPWLPNVADDGATLYDAMQELVAMGIGRGDRAAVDRVKAIGDQVAQRGGTTAIQSLASELSILAQDIVEAEQQVRFLSMRGLSSNAAPTLIPISEAFDEISRADADGRRAKSQFWARTFEWQYRYDVVFSKPVFGVVKVACAPILATVGPRAIERTLGSNEPRGFGGQTEAERKVSLLSRQQGKPDSYLAFVGPYGMFIALTPVAGNANPAQWSAGKPKDVFVPPGKYAIFLMDDDEFNPANKDDDIVDVFDLSVPFPRCEELTGKLGSTILGTFDCVAAVPPKSLGPSSRP